MGGGWKRNPRGHRASRLPDRHLDARHNPTDRLYMPKWMLAETLSCWGTSVLITSTSGRGTSSFTSTSITSTHTSTAASKPVALRSASQKIPTTETAVTGLKILAGTNGSSPNGFDNPKGHRSVASYLRVSNLITSPSPSSGSTAHQRATNVIWVSMKDPVVKRGFDRRATWTVGTVIAEAASVAASPYGGSTVSSGRRCLWRCPR